MALPEGPGGNTAPPSSARLRTAPTVFLALDGFLFSGRAVRIPAIKQQTGASAFSLGLTVFLVAWSCRAASRTRVRASDS